MTRRTFSLASLILAACTALPAQQPATAPPSPNLAGIAHVALRVHDLAASIAFYEKLGFVKAFDLSRDGKVYEAFIKINDHQFIELYPIDEKNTQVGFLHVCFEGNNLQSVHDYYVTQGLTPNAVRTAGAGNLLFTMPGPMTPQGPQNLEYTQYMPGSLHSKDFGQHLGPNRISSALTAVNIATNEPEPAKKFYVEKMGFKAASKPASSFVSLPGVHAQGEIGFTPAGSQMFKAALTFSLGQTKKSQAETKLKASHIPFTADSLGDPVLLDPDANELHLRGPHAL